MSRGANEIMAELMAALQEQRAEPPAPVVHHTVERRSPVPEESKFNILNIGISLLSAAFSLGSVVYFFGEQSKEIETLNKTVEELRVFKEVGVHQMIGKEVSYQLSGKMADVDNKLVPLLTKLAVIEVELTTLRQRTLDMSPASEEIKMRIEALERQLGNINSRIREVQLEFEKKGQ